MSSVSLPIWLRFVLVTGLIVLAAGAGLFAYRWYARPTTLTIAVGSYDGEAGKVVSAIASRLAATSAPVRLSVVEADSALGAASAFSSGKVDLAVVRADVGDLSKAQAVVIVARAVALIVAPPGSPITEIAGLKRRTVGVVGGDINQKLVGVLTREYDLTRANVVFKNLAPSEARRALEAKEVSAILIVLPLTEKYLTLVRGLFPQNAKSAPVLIPIESAGAIAETERAYESFDVPKGTLRGAPPVPEDDLTTVRVSFYLVANKKLDSDLMASFTQSFLAARRDLVGELPILAQVAAPDTDPSAYLTVHPGAAAYYNGTQLSFMDRWSNTIYLTPMLLGGVLSLLAAAWRFLNIRQSPAEKSPLDFLYALGRKIRKAEKESELTAIEDEIDEILTAERTKATSGDDDAIDVTALNVAAHRLENLIHDRRAILAAGSAVGAAPNNRVTTS